MYDLNDIRYFLAVSETGSLSGAARKLGVTQPTVGRRIKAMEDALDARLFERLPNGLLLSSTGEEILDSAIAIEENAWIISNQVSGEEKKLEGKVSLATSEGLASTWVLEKIPLFHEQHPDITLEIIGGISQVDMLRRESDVALRIGSPGDEELVGQCLGKVGFGLYASTEYLAQFNEPRKLSDLADHKIIEAVGEIANFIQARELRSLTEQSNIGLFTNNLAIQTQAVVNGLGITSLPNYVAERSPNLKRILLEEFETTLDIWLLTHRGLKFTARVSAVRDFFKDQIKNDKTLLVQ